jgi:hypothetical protein
MNYKRITFNTFDYITELFNEGIIDEKTYCTELSGLTDLECKKNITPGYITELFEKGIIDEDIYDIELSALTDCKDIQPNDIFEKNIIDDETDNDELDAECEEDFIPEYKFIYMVVINKNRKLFYIHQQNTHWAFDIPKTKVYYIKVSTESPEYQSAFYNSKVNEFKVSTESPEYKTEFYINNMPSKSKITKKNKIQLNLYESSIDI